MNKYVKLMALPLAFTLFAVGCGTTSNQQAGQDNKAKTELEQIKANGKIQIGTEGTYAPFTFHDKSGNLTGFDV
ncbi:MAG: amino acid ABC transporter substrate-binding protein, partial [Tumebacillaceae bacterium]